MPQRTGISRRRFVQIGGGVAAVALTGGFASADSHDDGEERNEGGESSDEESMEGGEEEVANVRVAHLSPDAPNVDVFVDDEAVLEDVPFKAVSEYLELPAGSYNVKVAPAGAGSEEAVLEEDLDVPAADLTVAAIGEVADENQPLELAVFEDDNSDPGDDTARIRAVHASPDAPAVDVVVAETGDTLFEGVEFGDSGYAEVPAGSYRLCVYPAGEREEAVLGVDVDAAGGTVASAFAAGYVAPEDAPADEPFDLVLSVDSA
ncbi:DUF4397 domain-containing protein [Halalkalicoccus ordinarius]|uniref:DUF4397 domain-containing protein n=1 Tax=Halalkalicoccus ordinarius TaxID=3116651 RepID=UPI00300EB97F